MLYKYEGSLFTQNSRYKNEYGVNALGYVATAGSIATDIIQLSRSQKQLISYKFARLLFLDKDKNPLGTYISLLTTQVVDIPFDAYYFIASTATTNLSACTVNYGSLQQAKEGLVFTPVDNKYLKDIEKLRTFDSVLHIDDNLFTKINQTVDSSISSSGETVTISGFNTTDYIIVDTRFSKVLFAKYWVKTSTTIKFKEFDRYAFYDRDKKLIQLVTLGNVSIIDIPDNACYVRFTYTAGIIDNIADVRYINKNETKLSVYNKKIEDSIVDIRAKTFGRLESYTLKHGYRIDANGILSLSDNGIVTDLIQVDEYCYYYASTPPIKNWWFQVYYYDRDGMFISAEMYDVYFKTPSNCRYIAFNYQINDNGSIYTRIDLDICRYNYLTNNFGREIANNDKLIAKKLDGGILSNTNIKAVFDNNIVFYYALENNILRYCAEGFNKLFNHVSLQINNTNFPNLKPSAIYNPYPVFFNTNAGVRCMIFIDETNQIYYSDGVVFGNFKESSIWSLEGGAHKHWSISSDDKDPSGKRFRKWYPSDVASRQRIGLWHNGPVWLEGIGGQYSRGLCFANYTNNSNSSKGLPSCLFYTEDGKNIYVQYEFGIYPKYYKIDNIVKENTVFQISDKLNTTGFESYVGGLTLKERFSVIPSALNTDPISIFEYGNSVNITSIEIGPETKITVSNNVFNVGSIVVIEGTHTGVNYPKIINNTTSGNSAGTGVMFVVLKISSNTLTLGEVIGNPENNLFCRHIHGISEFGNGLCLYTGEEYPESWFIYIRPSMLSASDGYNMNTGALDRTAWESIRLNSSKDAQQRSLGVYLRSDGKMISMADSNFPILGKLTVRGLPVNMGNFGLSIFDLVDIDDASKCIPKLTGVNAGYSLYPIGGSLFFSDLKGKTYISYDEGDTWEYVCTDGTDKSFIIGWDKDKKRFYFNNARNKQFVIELK